MIITLSGNGSILAIENLGYILWQKRKYNITNQKNKQNSKGNKLKSNAEIINQIKSNFIKMILNKKMMQVLLIVDGYFLDIDLKKFYEKKSIFLRKNFFIINFHFKKHL